MSFQVVHHRFERGRYVLFASRLIGAGLSGTNLFSLYRKGAKEQVIEMARCVRAIRIRDLVRQGVGI